MYEIDLNWKGRKNLCMKLCKLVWNSTFSQAMRRQNSEKTKIATSSLFIAGGSGIERSSSPYCCFFFFFFSGEIRKFRISKCLERRIFKLHY